METVEKIYTGLRKHRGSISTLAQRSNVTPQYINMVLRGIQKDEQLVLEASKLWKELEEARLNLNKQIESNIAIAEECSRLQTA